MTNEELLMEYYASLEFLRDHEDELVDPERPVWYKKAILKTVLNGNNVRR